jgi:hypothetical protein
MDARILQRSPARLLCCDVMDVDPSAMTEAGAAGEAATELAPGAQVAKYRLDRVLGSGRS